jgi:hypothetical protein
MRTLIATTVSVLFHNQTARFAPDPVEEFLMLQILSGKRMPSTRVSAKGA